MGRQASCGARARARARANLGQAGVLRPLDRATRHARCDLVRVRVRVRVGVRVARCDLVGADRVRVSGWG